MDRYLGATGNPEAKDAVTAMLSPEDSQDLHATLRSEIYKTRLRLLLKFAPLTGATLELNSERLNIHCATPAQVDRLLEIEVELAKVIYQITGHREFEVWFCGEEICHFTAIGVMEFEEPEEIELESESTYSEETPMPAVLDRPTQSTAKATNSKSGTTTLQTFDAVVNTIAGITHQSTDAIGGLVLEAVPNTTWKFQGNQFLLPANAVIDTLNLHTERVREAIAGMAKTPMAIEPEQTAEPVIEHGENGSAPKPAKTSAAAKRKAVAKKPAAKRAATTRAPKAVS